MKRLSSLDSLAYVAVATCLRNTAIAFVLPTYPRSMATSSLHSRYGVDRVSILSYPGQYRRSTMLRSTAETDVNAENLEEEIKAMRAGPIKKELESYGISTKAFLEKSELVTALLQARKEGKTPVVTASSSTVSDATSSETSSTATSSDSSATNQNREELIAKELEQTSAMRIAELKKELEDVFGVSTKSFLEKKELAQALAEARVSEAMGGASRGKKKKKKRRTSNDDDDEEEVKAAKVEVITSDDVGPRKNKGETQKKQRSPSGGMGDMGGIADMLKNMGGGGGAPGGAGGGSPDMGGIADMLKNMGGGGGGMGGMGGMGDVMKQAQEAMGNPKVQAVMAKAQKNPKVMQAVQECMGNPSAMGKYMNDPDVGPIMKELQEAMMS